MAVKKHKLTLSIEENYCLLGIVSDEPDYKVCWRINQTFGMSFEKLDDLQLYHRKLSAEQFFSLFWYPDEDTMLTYRFIKNRSDQGYFLDEVKNLDYLIHIQGEIVTEKIDLFIGLLGSLPSVRMCAPVDLGKIKDRARLILW